MKEVRYLVLLLLLISPMLLAQTTIIHQKSFIHSKKLNRKVRVDLFMSQNYANFKAIPTLFLNDGQDFEQLHLVEALNAFHQSHPDFPLAVITLWANEKRLHEYGTTGHPDYKNRGNLADNYADFLRHEVMPKFKKLYPTLLPVGQTYIAGFSLGGLAAFDMAWEYPKLFAKAGVFSGSFWWRSKAYEEGYEDLDRIMHQKVRDAKTVDLQQQFWFECGTNDEESDRNNNGIIDSIDDTQDLMKELEAKGYQTGKQLTYYQIDGGEHNFQTWKAAFPVFLEWLASDHL